MTWGPELLLRELFTQAPGMMLLIEGPELRVTHASKLIMKLVGRDDLVGLSVRDLMPGSRAVTVLEQVFATGQPQTLLEPPMLFETTLPPVRYTRTYTPLKDDAGNVRAVVVHATDLDDQSRRGELERTLALFEAAPVMLALLTPPDWKLVLANRGLREYFGNRMSIGMEFRGLVPPGNPAIAAMDRAYKTGLGQTIEHVSQFPGFLGRTYSMSIEPLRAANGTPDGILVAGVEVTDQRRARQALEAQAHELELATRAKDQFLAMLGHELRNPLQPMLTAVQIMRLDGESSVALDMLEREVHHMTRLVGDLLDISRITNGVLRLEAEAMDIRAAIARGLDLASPHLDERQHRVTTELEKRTLGVSGDPHRLAQVVSNLLQNAAKFSAPGAPIHVAARRENDRIVLEVSDEGAGIAPELLTRMFDAFVQGDQALDRSIGGLGLGLTIVKNLVQAHNGTITARSKGVGHGSTFVVELPAVDLPPRSEGHRTSRLSQGRSASQNPLRILVVDDNVEATAFFKMGLGRFGHEVSVAHDGPSALELAKTQRPQVVLIDIGLPGMNGFELAELLRPSLEVPMIAITGYGEPADRERSRVAGFAAHLIKPVHLVDLEELIRKLAATPTSEPAG